MVLEKKFIITKMKKVESLHSLKQEKARRELFVKTLSYILLCAGALTMVGPFLWMVTTSLKEPGEVFSFQKI